MLTATRLTFKQKQFARKYVENKGNGKLTALQVYDTTDPHTAESIASENLSKPEIKATIDDIAKSVGVTSSLILDNFKKIAVKEPEKLTGDTILKANIEMAKILGLYPGSKHSRLNVNIKGSIKDMNFTDVKNELKVIDDELNKTLDEPTTTPTEAS